MRANLYHPVICARDVAASSAFYQRHFGFRVFFDSGWYVHLCGEEPERMNLGIVDCHHPSIPAGYRKPVQGMLINFEVDDVDAAYARLRAAGLAMLVDLADEAWGQRHFVTRDPDGVLLDVIKPIPPSPEFAKFYKAAGPGP